MASNSLGQTGLSFVIGNVGSGQWRVWIERSQPYLTFPGGNWVTSGSGVGTLMSSTYAGPPLNKGSTVIRLLNGLMTICANTATGIRCRRTSAADSSTFNPTTVTVSASATTVDHLDMVSLCNGKVALVALQTSAAPRVWISTDSGGFAWPATPSYTHATTMVTQGRKPPKRFMQDFPEQNAFGFVFYDTTNNNGTFVLLNYTGSLIGTQDLSSSEIGYHATLIKLRDGRPGVFSHGDTNGYTIKFASATTSNGLGGAWSNIVTVYNATYQSGSLSTNESPYVHGLSSMLVEGYPAIALLDAGRSTAPVTDARIHYLRAGDANGTVWI